MPTAVDVLDRIKTERRAKFAEETKPMREYIGQMQAMKAEQRQRTEAKEDYVWQAEQTAKMVEERRVADNKRQGEVARLYYGGGKVEDMLASGYYSAKEIETAMAMGKSPDFSSALKDVEKGDVGLNLKELMTKYPNLPLDQADVIVGAKLDSNYNEVYRAVESSEDGDKQKIIVKAFKEGKLTADQYDKMTASVLSGIKSQAALDLTNAKVMKEYAGMMQGGGLTFPQVADSEEFKKAVSSGSYSEKLSAGRKVLEDWKGEALNNDEIKSLFSRAVGKEPTDRQIDIANDPVNFAKNFINTDNKEFTVADRQNYTRELAETQAIFDGDTPYSKGSILAPQYMEDIDKAIKKKPKIAERWNIDPEKSFAEQYIDLRMFNGLINELGLEFKGDMGIIELSGEDKEEALRNKTINPRIANQNATPEESNYVNEMNRIARGGK